MESALPPPPPPEAEAVTAERAAVKEAQADDPAG